MFVGCSACAAEWKVRETQNLLIAEGRRSNPTRSRAFANSRFISTFFSISLDKTAFWSSFRKCLRSAVSPLCLNNENLTD